METKEEEKNNCRTMRESLGDIPEGSVGALIPFEPERGGLVEMEFVIGGKITCETVPGDMLRQATNAEAKSFIDAMWDVYDKTQLELTEGQ